MENTNIPINVSPTEHLHSDHESNPYIFSPSSSDWEEISIRKVPIKPRMGHLKFRVSPQKYQVLGVQSGSPLFCM